VLILGEILIKNPIVKGLTLYSKVEAYEYNKYIKTPELFIEYDTEINTDDSILNIPLLANVLPLAWLTGSDVHVRCLDKDFKESMDRLQRFFKPIFPWAPFSTEIEVNELVENKIQVPDKERRTALLFSGGADSMYSLLSNMDHKPRLIMNWGIDDFPYPERRSHWEKTLDVYRDFARREGLDFNLIKTNASQILDSRRIGHRFHRELYNGMIRAALQHSLVLLPLAAPLSFNKFDHLIIASTFIPSYDFQKNPRAAVPQADEMIVWANLNVSHDGFNLSRNEKIAGVISEYFKTNPTILRVCLRSPYIDGMINDSACEKCLRTIASLTLAGVDPNTCGFHVDESTFQSMKSYWENVKISHPGYHWAQIKNSIPEDIKQDFYGSREFFEWFRGFDFKTTKKSWLYVDAYNMLPYSLARLLAKVYSRLGIKVFQEPVKRE
jgi:hypothetical protein